MITDREISHHPLLSNEQRNLCRAFARVDQKRRSSDFTMLQFAEVCLRATGNNYAEVTDAGGIAAARADREHCRAALLYAYELARGAAILGAEVASVLLGLRLLHEGLE